MTDTEKTCWRYRDGPATRDYAQARIRGLEHDPRLFGPPYYEYLDADGRRAPAYAASRVRLRAGYVESWVPRDELERTLAGLPGCVSTEQVGGTSHSDRRRQVVAIFSIVYEEDGDE